MKQDECGICGKTRTDEPDYSPIQVITHGVLGWYSTDSEGGICPEHIAALMNEGNRTNEYVGWSK